MSATTSALLEIEKLLTQVLVVGLTVFAAAFTRKGIYGHDSDAVTGGLMIASVWALTILVARWRQGPSAWWLLISGTVVLAMPVTNLIVWLMK